MLAYSNPFDLLPGLDQVLTCTVGALAVALLYVLIAFRDGRAIGTRKRDDLDTVPGIPGLGNLLEFIRTSDRQLEWWTRARANQKDPSKPLSVTLPGRRLIDITRPEWIEYIQKTRLGVGYGKGPITYDILATVLGDGIFSVDGDKWLSQRKTTSKIFTANNFRGIITSSIAKDLKKLVDIVGQFADNGEAFDLSNLFFRFTLDTFCYMGFGQDLGALNVDKPVPFAAAFDYAQGRLSERTVNPFWKLQERFHSVGRRFGQAVQTIDEFAYSIIDEREKQGLGGGKQIDELEKQEGAIDLLSLYMAVRDEAGKPLSRKALKDAVLNLIIAGRDTTAQGLSWTFFRLMSDPSLLKPIRSELDTFEGDVDYDSFKSLVEILAAFHEGLRLHPSVPKAGWMTFQDDQLPGGPIVHKGDIVRWSDFEMGRMPEVWGQDAKEYKPSRWVEGGTQEGEEKRLKKESMWKFHAFNGGPRLCLGQNLALYEATSVMAALLKEFDFTFAPGWLETVKMMEFEKTPRPATSLTLPMSEPFMVCVKRRQL